MEITKNIRGKTFIFKTVELTNGQQSPEPICKVRSPSTGSRSMMLTDGAMYPLPIMSITVKPHWHRFVPFKCKGCGQTKAAHEFGSDDFCEACMVSDE